MDAAKERVIPLFLSFVSENWRKFLFPTAAIAVIVAYLLIPREQAQDEAIVLSDITPVPELLEEEPVEMIEPSNLTTAQPLVVDVKGAVLHPGVYALEEGDRLIDAINAAGGYLPNADSRLLNHAAKLSDELLIYVPLEGEELPEGEASLLVDAATSSSSSNAQEEGSKVNINSAEESELTTIPGIGPAKATAIIAYRNEHGSFKTPESLMEVTGIGQKTFDKLEHAITVN